jgi:hypothetical protein
MPPMPPTPELATPNAAVFTSALEPLADRFPEIRNDHNRILAAGQQLLEEAAISSEEFFSDTTRTLFFSAIASRFADLEERKGDMGDGAYVQEKRFIFDATMLLALRASDRYDELKDDISTEEIISDEAMEHALDRFTNRQVTADLQAAINAGLLDEAKARLRITPDNEDPYVLHVLNVATPDVLHGMAPDMPANLALEPWDGPTQKAYREDAAAYRQYVTGLQQNTTKFLAASGLQGIAMAWADRLNGRRHLCLALPTAEKLVYTDQPRAAHYTALKYGKDLHKLEHEYAHTQGGHNLDGKVFYGITLEERRADLAGGDKDYYDGVKAFVDIDLALLGLPLISAMGEVEKGIPGDKLWPVIVDAIGLQGALELALVAPREYINNARPMQKRVNEYIGGFDGFSRRLYASFSSERRQAIDDHIEQMAGLSSRHPKRILWYQTRRRYGLTFMTDKLEAAFDLKLAETNGGR